MKKIGRKWEWSSLTVNDSLVQQSVVSSTFERQNIRDNKWLFVDSSYSIIKGSVGWLIVGERSQYSATWRQCTANRSGGHRCESDRRRQTLIPSIPPSIRQSTNQTVNQRNDGCWRSRRGKRTGRTHLAISKLPQGQPPYPLPCFPALA